MTNHTQPEALRLAAEAVKAWSNVDDFWALPDSDCGEMVLGAIEEGDKYELLRIDADTYGTDGESLKLAQFYAAANPGAVLALLDERDSQHARIAELEAQIESIGAGGVNGPLMAPAAAHGGEADMRAVVAVAVTMLFDSHPNDVRRAFTIQELADMVQITEALGSQKVEAIYRRAWDALSHPSPPEGIVMVPREPTTEMVIAAYSAQGEASGPTIETIYSAMIAAAPGPADGESNV